MNRIQQLLDLHQDSSSTLTAPQWRWPRSASYSLFIPVHYEARYAYPLLVWLGDKREERPLAEIIERISLRNYVAVAPQCGGEWGQTEADESIFHALAQAQSRLNVSERRIFLAGHRQGGTHAIRMALRHPEQFAGAISIDGPFPDGASLGRLEEARRVPLLLALGGDSSFYRVGQACQDLRLIHSAGMDVSLRAYPGPSAMAQEQSLRDVDRWLMEYITKNR